jgi:glycine reductase complex component B subunit gamma
MVKAIESHGIPAVHVCSIVPISLTVGANRIVPSVAIPHPTGDPKQDLPHEKEIRRRLLMKAIKAISTDVTEQTIF